MTLVTENAAVVPQQPHGPAVSWAAIAAGGLAAAGFSLFLFQLGAGIGLSVVSPWSSPSATMMSVAAGISLCLISIMASALGGFIAGRLRTRRTGPHTDETYFRDSAHGFLAWAFALILGTIVASFAASSVAGGVTHGAMANPALMPDTTYYTDMLFRASANGSAAQGQNANEEIGRIIARGVARGGTLTAEDRLYIAQQVAARSGVSHEDAQRRVDTVIAQAKIAADDARKAAAKTAFWMATAMLCGALAAAFAAAEGGRERDQ